MQDLLPERTGGGDMEEDTDEKKDQIIKSKLNKWDRDLITISLPHAAAYGAFLSRYDLNIEGKDQIFTVTSMTFMIFFIPITTIWLFYVHDLMRNVFLRVGHAGFQNKFKHNIIFSIVFLFPVIFILFSWRYSEYLDIISVGMIGMTMMSWVFCATIVSNNSYIAIAKTLGVKTDV